MKATICPLHMPTWTCTVGLTEQCRTPWGGGCSRFDSHERLRSAWLVRGEHVQRLSRLKHDCDPSRRAGGHHPPAPNNEDACPKQNRALPFELLTGKPA